MSDLLDSVNQCAPLSEIDALAITKEIRNILSPYKEKLSLNQMFEALDLTKATILNLPLSKSL